jgi:hypothetical protein
LRRILFTLAVALALASSPVRAAEPSQPAGWKAVLIAGDDEELAFDNAVDAMAIKLAAFGVPSANIAVLKSSGEAVDAATIDNVRAAFIALAPGPNDGCFVYVTSHGAPGRGLLIRRAHGFLAPPALSGLLDRSCGTRPTVVVASGCYSGIFADTAPLPAPNRIILTAARDDRPSFGCNASREYTVFDQCLLASLQSGIDWGEVMNRSRTCVSGNEWDMHVEAPSDPQISIGTAVSYLHVFAH